MTQELDPLKADLRKIRDLYGVEKFKFAAAQSIRMIAANDASAKDTLIGLLKEIDPDIDYEQMLTDPAPVYPDSHKMSGADVSEAMMMAFKSSMPGIQTQAQLDLVLSAFDALKTSMNATFLGDKEAAQKAREALIQALDAAGPVTELSSKLGHVPEAATSVEAERFKNPPAQFTEVGILQELMDQLKPIDSLASLNEWYKDNRVKIDKVVTQKYRNTLLDTIRAKKKELTT